MQLEIVPRPPQKHPVVSRLQIWKDNGPLSKIHNTFTLRNTEVLTQIVVPVLAAFSPLTGLVSCLGNHSWWMDLHFYRAFFYIHYWNTQTNHKNPNILTMNGMSTLISLGCIVMCMSWIACGRAVIKLNKLPCAVLKVGCAQGECNDWYPSFLQGGKEDLGVQQDDDKGEVGCSSNVEFFCEDKDGSIWVACLETRLEGVERIVLVETCTKSGEENTILCSNNVLVVHRQHLKPPQPKLA